MTGLFELIRNLAAFNLQVLLILLGVFISLAAGAAAYYVTLQMEARRASKRKRAVADEVYDAVVRVLGDGAVPSRLLITSTINSISRERGLAPGDYPSANGVLEDLITGVMLSDFLSKRKRCVLIGELADRLAEEDVRAYPEPRTGFLAELKKNKINIALALITALLTFTLILFSVAAGSTYVMFIVPGVILVLVLGATVYYWVTAEKKLEFIAVEDVAAKLAGDLVESTTRVLGEKGEAGAGRKRRKREDERKS